MCGNSYLSTEEEFRYWTSFSSLKKANHHIGWPSSILDYLNVYKVVCGIQLICMYTHFCYCLVTIEISHVIITSCLSVPMGHFTLVIFPDSINPDLFSTAEHQVFISKHRVALLQFPSVIGMCMYMCACVYAGSAEIVTRGTFLPTLYREDLVPSTSSLHDVGMVRCTSTKSSLQ